MMENLRREHVIKETFHFYVKRDRVIQDALKRTLKPLFSANKEVIVRKNCLMITIHTMCTVCGRIALIFFTCVTGHFHWRGWK